MYDFQNIQSYYDDLTSRICRISRASKMLSDVMKVPLLAEALSTEEMARVGAYREKLGIEFTRVTTLRDKVADDFRILGNRWSDKIEDYLNPVKSVPAEDEDKEEDSSVKYEMEKVLSCDAKLPKTPEIERKAKLERIRQEVLKIISSKQILGAQR